MRRSRESGFTLIEVVVALAILGVTVAIVMQVFSSGLKNLRRIDLAHRAMGHAENVMNEILADGEITGAGSTAGELDEEFRYTAELVEWEPPGDELALDLTQPGIYLLLVTVRIHLVNDRFGKLYRLSSLKAVAKSLLPESLVESGNPMQQRTGLRGDN